MNNLTFVYGVIYKITNRINGKAYIGQTTQTIQERWMSHIYGHSKCFRLKSAIRKYGKDSFTVEIVDSASNFVELGFKEILWIIKEDTFNKGYNVKIGSYISPEIANKIRLSKVGKKMSEAAKANMKGKKRSAETIQKLKNAALGRIPWNKGTKKVKIKKRKCVEIYMFSKEYKLLKVFSRITDAAFYIIKEQDYAKKDKASILSNIAQCIKINRGCFYGYRWKSGNTLNMEFKQDYKPTPKHTLKSVIGIAPDNSLKKFESRKEAAEFINGNISNVSRSIKTGYSVNGWTFKNEENVGKYATC